MNIKQTPKQVLFNSQGNPIGFFIKMEEYDSLLKELTFLKDKVDYLKTQLESDSLPNDPQKEAFPDK